MQMQSRLIFLDAIAFTIKSVFRFIFNYVLNDFCCIFIAVKNKQIY